MTDEEINNMEKRELSHEELKSAYAQLMVKYQRDMKRLTDAHIKFVEVSFDAMEEAIKTRETSIKNIKYVSSTQAKWDLRGIRYNAVSKLRIAQKGIMRSEK